MSKVLEVLNTLDPQEVVFIGSSSGWFDINRAGAMRQHEYIVDLSEMLLKQFVALRDSSEKAFNELLKKQLQWSKGITLKRQYEEVWKGYVKETEDAYCRAVKYKENVETFVPLWEREVKETYERLQGDGTCIVVPGAECGRYWLISGKYPEGVPEYEGSGGNDEQGQEAK